MGELVEGTKETVASVFFGFGCIESISIFVEPGGRDVEFWKR